MILLFLLVGCGDTTTVDSNPPTEGTLSVRFQIDTDWQAEMDEDPVGPFWGSLYDANDVDNAGPYEGVEPLEGIYVESMDLTDGGGPSEVLWVTQPLENERVAILGFLDSDGNADPDVPDPDSKDPVTLPNDNKFFIEYGEVTEVTVWFKFLNP